MSHSSLSSLYNAFNKAHANNIRIYLEKCFFFTKSARRQRTCREEEIVRKRRIVRDISLIFNEFKDAPLWFLCNLCKRLQNSPYFCIFKYARAVKQKVWNEAENTRFAPVRLLRRFTDFFTDLEKRPTVLRSFMYWVKCNGARMVLIPSLYLFGKGKKPWRVRMKNLRALFSCIVIGDFGRERNARDAQGGREGNPYKEAIDLAILPTIYVCKNITTVTD